MVYCSKSIRKCVNGRFLTGAALVVFALTFSTVSSLLGDNTVAQRPDPVDAETAVTRFVLPDDVQIQLVAAEPDVIDPVAMQFGPDGRLWVIEMSDYPNGPPENGPPLSRLRVLSDADGDGRYSDPVTFADKLLFANGLMLWKDGVLVTTNGQVLFLRDTDGDGQADEREIWFEGFKKDNPQLRANHPTLGLDNHIYVASGLRGGEVIAAREGWKENAQPVSLSGRDFRFDPMTGTYESVSGVGQFGLCFDDFGNRFVCSNRNPCNHIVLEDHYLKRNPSLAVSKVHEDVSPAAEKSTLYPISRIWTTSNLHANQFTAACGLLIYRGGCLPSHYHGNSFTCEPTSNLIHRDVLTPNGATFTSRPGRDGVEFLATKDEWFRPVNLAHGPDGALYIADMYRSVIEHPEFMPVELKERSDLTNGRDRGRIYRIVPRESTITRQEPLNLGSASSEELVELLSSQNPWERDTATRLLLERQDGSFAPLLVDSVKSADTAATRVQALWLLDGIGQLERFHVAGALGDESPRVREQALKLAETHFADDETFRDRCVEILNDPDSDERLLFQAALSIGSFPASDATTPALASVVAKHAGDHWLCTAVATSAAETMPTLLVSVIEQWSNDEPRVLDDQIALIEQYADMIGARKQDAEVALLLDVTPELARGPEASQQMAFAVINSVAGGLRRSGDRLQRHLKRDDLLPINLALDVASDDRASSEFRVEAVSILGHLDADRVIAPLAHLVKESEDQSITLAAVDAIAQIHDPRTTEILLDGFRGRTPRVRNAILAEMTTPERISHLLDEIDAGRIAVSDLDPTFRQRVDRLTDAELKARANQLLASNVDADRQKVITLYQPALSLPHDLQRGRDVFAKTCATCHRVGDVGVNVGADISDTRTKTPEQLLTNILDPNKAVDGNYFGYSIIDTEGRIHTGIITNETSSSVTLRQPEGKDVTLLRRDIDELVSTGKSLMPVGLEKNVDVQQMADLLSYLKNWRYVGGTVPGEVIGQGTSE
ncbi:MAG: HEAT repeat domain-containing protein [Planctomycetaceae bacterium]|nr:HEAT repeat domain-containing protein [Planctomycetaceae bacterium]